MAALHMDIVTPRGLVFSGIVKSCVAPGIDGEFCVLENHTALLAVLGIGSLRFDGEGGEKILATSGGFLEVHQNRISVMVETAEWAGDIDQDRAKAAAERARRRLEQKQDIDIPRAKLALARALNRLKIASRT
jgi:F-type H+-transporting ATPase subunit epsilon